MHFKPTMDVVSLDSQLSSLSKVNFIELRDQYSYNEDLVCRYTTGSYYPVEGDRIAIYKSGWLYVKDYYLFEWAPITENCVQFNHLSLPRDDNEFYQFCYISADNEVLGASKTFQFTEKVEGFNSMSGNSHNIVFSLTNGADHDQELQKLREENDILKETVKLLMGRKASPRNYDRDIVELKGLIYGLKDVVNKQAGEINLLKNQVKVCIECNRNLLEEKTELLKKYEGMKLFEPPQNEVKSLQDFDIGELESIPPFPFAK